MLDMVEIVQKQINQNEIILSSKLFDNLVKVYIESQQWTKISSLLQNSTQKNCTPQQRIVGYLKKNIIYCFDAAIRSQLKENVDNFDKRFFSFEARKQQKDSEMQNVKASDEINQQTVPPRDDSSKSLEM